MADFTLTLQKSRMPQIQGVTRVKLYLHTANPCHALVYTRAGDCGILLFIRTAAFLEGEESRP
jgi:hypothetical protein